MDRSTMFKVMYKLNKIFTILNKYFYIIPIITMVLSFIGDNKISKLLYKIIKIILILSIVLSSVTILYFTDIVTPVNHTYSLYNDLVEPYIEVIKHLWNKLTNYFTNMGESVIKESTSQGFSNIKDEIKGGIKEGIKESLDELVENIESTTQSDILKQFALYSSGLFLIYFIFILPGASTDPSVICQYNWINQSLIELKINIINYFTNPSNPGNPGNLGDLVNPVINHEVVVEFPIEATNSGSSVATVTPNTMVKHVSVGTQTIIDGKTVGKMVETLNLLPEVIGEAESDQIREGVNKIIVKITD